MVGSCFPDWGGAEFHVLQLSEELIRRGHQVTLTCRPGRFVHQEALRRGIRTITATCEHPLDWQDFPTYLELLRREHFDVLHVHWENDYVIAPMAAKLRGVPVVATHHFPFRFEMPLATLHSHNVQALFQRIIAISEYVRKQLLNQGFAAEHVTTIHHGTDTHTFRKTSVSISHLRNQWGVKPNYFVVGFVGRLSEEKGIIDLVASLALLRDLPIHLVVLGDGPLLPLLRSNQSEEDNITFTGYCPDINNAINALDVLVLPSVWPEPCAAVVQQAMAFSKPVIATNTGGTPEMVVDKKTGFLVSPSSPDSITLALRQLYDMPAFEREAMGQEGLQRVMDCFSLASMVSHVETVYQEVCQSYPIVA